MGNACVFADKTNLKMYVNDRQDVNRVSAEKKKYGPTSSTLRVHFPNAFILQEEPGNPDRELGDRLKQ